MKNLNQKYILLLLLFTITCTTNSLAVNLTGMTNSHDPATLIKDGNIYWHFTTGDGIWSSKSTNLSYWSASNKPVFPRGTWPSWVDTYVPDFGGSFWAPDAIFMNGAYYIYYSCSQWGTTKSAIGVAKSESLNNPQWTDLGMVVNSNGTSAAINAIDPGMFRDDDGQIYMVYGSWFGGIGIVDIDSVSGLATSTVKKLYGGNHQSIEAPYLFKEDSYYYLVVNRGTCCNGVNSTYYITVGRSENVKGPYSDFINLLVKSGIYIGPGHFGLLREPCANYVSTHYYDGNDNGFAKLDILKMTMVDGYPSLTRDFTFVDCGDTTEIDNVLSNSKGIKVYPNPAVNGVIYIELNKELQFSTKIQLNIYSNDGKEVYSNQFEAASLIELETGLKKGIYNLQIQSEQTVFTQKFRVE